MADVVNVLWTGGWDSTFRVLFLVFHEKAMVQPHYLFDPGRQSSRFELQAITRITQAVEKRGVTDRLRPTEVVEIGSIPIDSRERECHAALVERYRIGPQYLWLAEYARLRDVSDLELSIHVDDRAYAVVAGGEITSNWSEGGMRQPERLFDRFAFPILNLSKLEMKAIAERESFADLMEMTWFCHLPVASGAPCGFCNPCRWTAEEGLEERIPWTARMRRYLVTGVVNYLPGFRVRRGMKGVLRRFS